MIMAVASLTCGSIALGFLVRELMADLRTGFGRHDPSHIPALGASGLLGLTAFASVALVAGLHAF